MTTSESYPESFAEAFATSHPADCPPLPWNPFVHGGIRVEVLLRDMAAQIISGQTRLRPGDRVELTHNGRPLARADVFHMTPGLVTVQVRDYYIHEGQPIVHLRTLMVADLDDPSSLPVLSMEWQPNAAPQEAEEPPTRDFLDEDGWSAMAIFNGGGYLLLDPEGTRRGYALLHEDRSQPDYQLCTPDRVPLPHERLGWAHTPAAALINLRAWLEEA